MLFGLQSLKTEVDPTGGGGSTTITQNRTVLTTTVGDNPWNIFTSNVAALYYFDSVLVAGRAAALRAQPPLHVLSASEEAFPMTSSRATLAALLALALVACGDGGSTDPGTGSPGAEQLRVQRPGPAR